MKRSIILFVSLILLLLLMSCGCSSRVSNTTAVSDENSRNITIVNDTNQTINEIRVFVGEGTEIKNAYIKNPDDKSVSIRIPDEFTRFDSYTIVMIDNYGMKYAKTVSNDKQKGWTEIIVSEEDYVEQDGDLWKKIEKFFNGD